MRRRRDAFTALGVLALVVACASQPVAPTPSASLTPGSGGPPAATPTRATVATPVPSATDSVLWREPPSYTFTLESTCGERALIGTFNVEVRDGETIAVEAVSGYFVQHPEALPPSAVPTLNDLLAEAADARSRDADRVSVLLDPSDGHPAWISIDWKMNTIDDEACYQVTNYLPAA